METLTKPIRPANRPPIAEKKPRGYQQPKGSMKGFYIQPFMEPIKTAPLPQLMGDIQSDIDLCSIEYEVKVRLEYMFDEQGNLHVEYKDLYRSKLKNMIAASLYRLASESQIRAILIGY